MRWFVCILLLACSTTVAAPLPEYNVANFGAIPNDGLTDTAAFQKAFDAAKAASPATVIIPRGTWTMTDGVRIEDANDITVKAEGAIIQATVRICPYWFQWEDCTNIQWHGGKFVGNQTYLDIYDRYVSLEGVNRTISAIGTDDYISVATNVSYEGGTITATTYDHGLRVGDTVTISGSNSTPSIDGTRTVTALHPTNPLGKFKVGVDVTVAGTAGTLAGKGEMQIQSVTAASPPVVTVDSTSGFVDGDVVYIDYPAGATTPAPRINLDNAAQTANVTAIEGTRTIDVLSATTFTFTETAETPMPVVSTPQTTPNGEVRHGVDDTPGANDHAGTPRLGDLEVSAVFTMSSGSGHGFHGLKFVNCERCINNDTASDWMAENIQAVGPFAAGWDTGLRHIVNDHKQAILPTYVFFCEGGHGFTIKNVWVQGHAGAFTGGVGDPIKLDETDQAEAYMTFENVNCRNFFDNGIYVSSGRNAVVRGGHIRDGITAGTGIKFRGWGHRVFGTVVEGVDTGFGMEGTLAPTTLDDQWGAGAAQQVYQGCIARNCTSAGIWVDDNKGMWPRDLTIRDCEFINCGAQILTAATVDLPATMAYGQQLEVLTDQNRAPVNIENVDRLTFENNTIDDSESGGIAEVDASTDGYLLIRPVDNHYSARRIGFNSFVTVAGSSDAAANGSHFVVGLAGDPDVTPGVSDATAGLWWKTNTTYSGAGTGGTWSHPRNGYAVYLGLFGNASNKARSATTCTVRNNKIIGSKSGFYLAGVADTLFDGNIGVGLNEDGGVAALFKVADCRKSIFRNNRVEPHGNRLIHVDSSGTWTGNSVDASNYGAQITSNARTDIPSMTNAALWLRSDSTVDTGTGGAVKGDPAVLYIEGTDHIHAESWQITDGGGVAAWLDSLTRMRAEQVTSTKRPTYELNTAAGGSDADALNAYAILRFDGTNDLLRMKGPISLAQSGTIYIVAKCTNDTSDVTLFSSTDEDTATTYFLVKRRTSDDRLQVRLRNGGADTESVYNAAANSWPLNTWKIFRIATDGTNVSFSVSNGAGAMASSTPSITGADGRWFGDVDGLLWRDSLVIGGHVLTDTEQSFFPGDVAEIIIYDGDVSANYTAIEAALFAKYGAL